MTGYRRSPALADPRGPQRYSRSRPSAGTVSVPGVVLSRVSATELYVTVPEPAGGRPPYFHIQLFKGGVMTTEANRAGGGSLVFDFSGLAAGTWTAQVRTYDDIAPAYGPWSSLSNAVVLP